MNKIVIITGGSSGIGLATGLYLSNKGYTIYSLSRRKLDNAIKYISCDITKEEEVIKSIQEIINKEGKIDIVINNAGIGIAGPIEETNLQKVKEIIDVNFIGVVNVCKYTIPYLRESKGKIINIGSVAGVFAIPFQAYYSATKSALQAYSYALANELKPFMIKVTCILPGDTKTNFTNNRDKENLNEHSLYQGAYQKSIGKMEQDEQNGKSPLTVSKVIYKVIKQKNPPLKVTVGIGYKVLVFLNRLLPTKLINYLIRKLY